MYNKATIFEANAKYMYDNATTSDRQTGDIWITSELKNKIRDATQKITQKRKLYAK